MPRISTDNYDTVASWNGSQDLFVVEQSDGTKVATPAMVKQFIEAGDFEATGEVKDGHGNKLSDMAKSADVATALAGKQNTLTFDNAPTASSNNPVKSGGIKTYVDNAVSYKAGDVIASENIIVAAMGYNASDCYFTMPLSKPVVASSVSISNIKCTVYYGTNQKEVVSGATYTGAIQPNSILIKMTKANTFTEGGRYVIDFKGIFTFF